ncbi:hypothetical protein [Sandaracinus amylolyticus]|uniref:Uncharacterized protein n=1 Tax=Sandaracinus amylolyticus TaxID=927083 RepID=A0A0F6YH50_9BACT|nr:hypothetical protein [Sandaracinus amylolyticus]AKF04591.1 hypothetical protein DB32_001740 [Sandaracinus amylolyticus]
MGAALVLAAWTIAPSTARADLTIAAPSCSEVDLAEVQRLLEVELADVTLAWREASTPVVLLGCTGDRVRIEITDPITDKSVARTLVWPSVDRERVLALAIAQLFLTSWLELLIDGDAAVEGAPGAEEAERMARGAMEDAQQAQTSPPPEPVVEAPRPEPVDVVAPPVTPPAEAPAPRTDAEISLEGGTRMRLDGETLATASAGLRGAMVIDDAIVVGLRLATEFARTSRMRGDIDVYAATLGIGAAWRTPNLGPLFADLGVWVAGDLLVLEGRPASLEVEGGTTIAIAAEAQVEVAPSLRVGPVVISVPLGLGVLAFAPDGEVTDEPPVIVGGPFFAAALRVAITPSQF